MLASEKALGVVRSESCYSRAFVELDAKRSKEIATAKNDERHRGETRPRNQYIAPCRRDHEAAVPLRVVGDPASGTDLDLRAVI